MLKTSLIAGFQFTKMINYSIEYLFISLMFHYHRHHFRFLVHAIGHMHDINAVRQTGYVEFNACSLRILLPQKITLQIVQTDVVGMGNPAALSKTVCVYFHQKNIMGRVGICSDTTAAAAIFQCLKIRGKREIPSSFLKMICGVA